MAGFVHVPQLPERVFLRVSVGTPSAEVLIALNLGGRQ
jgi:hypothetical protein